MRIVIARGGNALLRRGRPVTQKSGRRPLKTSVKASGWHVIGTVPAGDGSSGPGLPPT